VYEQLSPRSVEINNDGTKLFVGNVEGVIYYYELSTAWDMSTMDYKGFRNLSTHINDLCLDITFKTDGTMLYMTDRNERKIHQFILSTPWDLQTATYDTFLLIPQNVAGDGNDAERVLGITFKPDGTQMYFTTRRHVIQYSLSTPWDIDTGTFTDYNYVGYWRDDRYTPPEIYPYSWPYEDIMFNPTGTVVMFPDLSRGSIVSTSLSTPWDISSMNHYCVDIGYDMTECYAESTYQVRRYTPDYYFDNWEFSNDGNHLYIKSGPYRFSDPIDGPLHKGLMQYELNNFNLSTLNRVKTISNEALHRALYTMYLDESGTRFYYSHYPGEWPYNDHIRHYSLSTPFDIDTLSFVRTTPFDEDIYDFTFRHDGTRLYWGDNRDIFQHHLSTAWNLNTESYNQEFRLDSFYIHKFFNSDGTKLFGGRESDQGRIFKQFDLSSAWNVMSIEETASFDTGIPRANDHGLTFNQDGTKMYHVDPNTGSFVEYTLANAYSLEITPIETWFEYRKTGDIPWESSAIQEYSSLGTFEDEIVSLQSNTEYQYRAKARVEYEGNIYTSTGPTLTFTTLSAEPYVTTEDATNILSNYADLRAGVQLNDYNEVNLSFSYKEIGSPTWIETPNQTINTSGIKTQGVYLDPLTNYEFKAIIYYNSQSQEGDILTFATPEQMAHINLIPSVSITEVAKNQVKEITFTAENTGTFEAYNCNISISSVFQNFTDIVPEQIATVNIDSSEEIKLIYNGHDAELGTYYGNLQIVCCAKDGCAETTSSQSELTLDVIEPPPMGGGGAIIQPSPWTFSIRPTNIDTFIFFTGSLFNRDQSIPITFTLTKPQEETVTSRLREGNLAEFAEITEQTDDNIIVTITIPHEDLPKVISGELLVSNSETKTATITYRILNLGASIDFERPIGMSPGFLSPLILKPTQDETAIQGIRWWFVITLTSLTMAILIKRFVL